MNTSEIAATFGRPEADVMETLRMLGLPLPGESVEPATQTPSGEERATLRGRGGLRERRALLARRHRRRRRMGTRGSRGPRATTERRD
jgi:hypothetical protein